MGSLKILILLSATGKYEILINEFSDKGNTRILILHLNYIHIL